MRQGWIVAALIAAPVAAQTKPTPAPPAPSAEAEALGKRIAERGTLGALLPIALAKDVTSLLAEHKDLDAAHQDRLRATATTVAQTASAKLVAAVGHQYALRLSLADLRALAAFGDSPAAKAWRAAEPAVIIESVKATDGFDLKKEAWAAYCRDPAAKCPAGK